MAPIDQLERVETKSIPEFGFLRIGQVLEIIPICKTTWWEGIKKGIFPKGVKLGNVTMWRIEDIKDLVERISEGNINYE